MFCHQCGAKIADNSAFCYKCGSKITQTAEIVAAPPTEVAPPQYTPAKIKEYLGHAKTLEVNKFTLERTKTRLQQIINSLGYRGEFTPPDSEAWKAFDAFWGTAWILFLIGTGICVFTCGNLIENIISVITIALIFFNAPLFNGMVVTGIVALCGSLIICTIRRIGLVRQYKAAYREYEKRVAADNKRVVLEKEQIKALRSQQAQLNTEIKKIDAMLRKLYSLNIIYPKYRELIPIVTMYEYFDSRRCYDLVGPGGAYNLYEDESRHDIIISNLNQVMSMLSHIEKNQRMLYEAVQESNYQAENIYRQASAMLKSSKVIEHNTAIAAYNSKIAAENSAISAYIDLRKFYA